MFLKEPSSAGTEGAAETIEKDIISSSGNIAWKKSHYYRQMQEQGLLSRA